MICTCLEGGLGNQLFQYAAGRALAYHHNTDLLLDTARLSINDPRVTPRSLEIHRFTHCARVTRQGERTLPMWMHRVPVLARFVSPWRIYLEKSEAFDSQLLELPDQTYLRGYWQSFRYFESIAAVLYRELLPVEPLSPSSLEVVAQIDAANGKSVAVHVRRGDYVSLASAESFHGVLPLSYYEGALDCIYERVKTPRLFIFSDDTNWCRQNLPLNEHDAVFVAHNGGSNAWQDLILMSHCRHHVIANSSFSWWGAWLADQRWLGLQRFVIAPSRWFARRKLENAADRFPPHWTVL